MRNRLLFILLFLMGASISNISTAEEGAISIAVVNVAYLMKNAPEAEKASLELKAKFSPREKVLQDEKDQIKALETERETKKNNWTVEQVKQADRTIRSLERERTRALEDFREELRFARDSALDEVQKSVFQAIEDVRKQRNIDIIIQEYVAASPRVDITTDVLSFLETKANSMQPIVDKNKPEK